MTKKSEEKMSKAAKAKSAKPKPAKAKTVKSKKSAAKAKSVNKKQKKSVQSPADGLLEGSEKKLKQIWLAGMGAYGVSVETLQNKVGEIKADRQEVFDQLVERGALMQDETNQKLSQKIEAVEGRIDKIKQQLTEGYSASKIAQGVDQLATRLEKIKKTKR